MSIHTILLQEIVSDKTNRIYVRSKKYPNGGLIMGEEVDTFLKHLATRIVEEVIREIDGVSKRHRCVNCHTIYAEYVNGCPKCWEKYEKPFKVIPFPLSVLDIRTKLQKMKEI